MKQAFVIFLFILLSIALASLVFAIPVYLVFAIKYGLSTSLSLTVKGLPEIFAFMTIPVCLFQFIKKMIQISDSTKRFLLHFGVSSLIVLLVYFFLTLINYRSPAPLLKFDFLITFLIIVLGPLAITSADAFLSRKIHLN